MSIPDITKKKFFEHIGGESRIKNYEELVKYFDNIYNVDIWDKSTIQRVNIIRCEEIGSALDILFSDHPSWKLVNLS